MLHIRYTATYFAVTSPNNLTGFLLSGHTSSGDDTHGTAYVDLTNTVPQTLRHIANYTFIFKKALALESGNRDQIEFALFM